MHNLKAITPLGAFEAQVDNFNGLRIMENPSRALVALTIREGQGDVAGVMASTLLGVELPVVSRSVLSNPFSVFWIGPDSWMIDAEYEGNEDLAHQVKQAMGNTASVVEQTDGWCRFDLEGVAEIAVLERLCNADAACMKAGDVTRTQIHHMGCFLWRQDAGFTVIGPRSSAKSLHHALITAAQSTC